MSTVRKYPVGIQTFSRIIEEGYVYVDKTDLVWQLAHCAPFVFLSRPRRFGKSLLTSTLESYFRAEKEYFEGLKIMPLEKEWTVFPVIKLDMSEAKAQPTAEALKETLMWMLKPYTELYGKDDSEVSPGKMLTGIINRAEEQTGKKVVVIIDEYDAPLLDVLHKGEVLEEMRQVMQEMYVPLKANERHLRYCFITGITKFSQLSIFSTINNLANVTMDRRFAHICGITEQELMTVMKPDIEMLAEEYELTYDEMLLKLKIRYDGYHFAKESEDIYNPFSLIRAFMHREVTNYWFDSGTPTFLLRQMQHFNTDIMSLDCIKVAAAAFDQPTENMRTALPLLYQSGYITIKGYDRESEEYTLSIPNQEVRIGYVMGLMDRYTGLDEENVRSGFAVRFWKALKQGDVEQAMRDLQSFMAGIPYVEGFKKKLAEVAVKEGFYEYTMWLIFSMLNFYVRTQVKCQGGRVDMVVRMPDTTYVFEFKTTGTAGEALAQIDGKHYALPYQFNGNKVVKVGVKFNADTRVPEEWKIV